MASTSVYTVTPGRALRLKSLMLTVTNTSPLVGRINLRDGGVTGPILVPVTIPLQSGISTAFAFIPLTFEVPLRVTTALFMEMAAGTLTASIAVVGFETT